MDNPLAKFALDTSSEVHFDIRMTTANGRLSPEQRHAMLQAIRNAARMVRAQVVIAGVEGVGVSLVRRSSRTGQVPIALTEDDDG